MPHTVLPDVAAAVDIQTGAVVSRVIFRDDRTEVTVFGFDAGEGLFDRRDECDPAGAAHGDAVERAQRDRDL